MRICLDKEKIVREPTAFTDNWVLIVKLKFINKYIYTPFFGIILYNMKRVGTHNMYIL